MPDKQSVLISNIFILDVFCQMRVCIAELLSKSIIAQHLKVQSLKSNVAKKSGGTGFVLLVLPDFYLVMPKLGAAASEFSYMCMYESKIRMCCLLQKNLICSLITLIYQFHPSKKTLLWRMGVYWNYTLNADVFCWARETQIYSSILYLQYVKDSKQNKQLTVHD